MSSKIWFLTHTLKLNDSMVEVVAGYLVTLPWCLCWRFSSTQKEPQTALIPAYEIKDF